MDLKISRKICRTRCQTLYLIGDWTSIWQKFQHCHSNAYAGWNSNEVSGQLIIVKLRDAFDDVQKGELHDRHGAEDESAVDKRIELEHDANSANPNWHWTKPETQKIGARDQNDMAYHLRSSIMWVSYVFTVWKNKKILPLKKKFVICNFVRRNFLRWFHVIFAKEGTVFDI